MHNVEFLLRFGREEANVLWPCLRREFGVSRIRAPASGRNYDYRNVWFATPCSSGIALAAACEQPLMERIVGFARERVLEDGPQLKPAYTTHGGLVPAQSELELPGYPGGHRVYIGNRAGRGFQLDTFGEALLLFAAAAGRDRLDADGWRAAEIAAAAIEARRDEPDEPDAGVWETEPRWWTHSCLICAAGLRQLAARHAPVSSANRWLALADSLLAEAAARCLHPTGRWQRSPDDGRIDAALLTCGLRGALPPGDPRTAATLAAVHSSLTDDGYAYRYRVDERPLGEAEGAFLLCGFWVSLAFLEQGDRLSAFRWFERNRAACGTPSLFTEEFDVRQRQLRSNLPQAFVHALMLECAARLGPGLPEGA